MIWTRTTRSGFARLVLVAIIAVIFATTAVIRSSGTGPYYGYETLYYENLTQREILVVQQRLRLDEPAAAVLSTSLQEDGWSHEPVLESPVSVRDGPLKKAAASNEEWLEAASAGVVATTVSMTTLYFGGVRFDWV